MLAEVRWRVEVRLVSPGGGGCRAVMSYRECLALIPRSHELNAPQSA